MCDPATGSGHFLIAAAHRLARHLARARTAETEPTPDDYQHALRDVIGHCIYGVDVNPMAVELCKVSLWMEALEPGKPLSFLDHHIQCGNSLLGATPALLAKGIPDEAFKPIEGDDRKLCAELKKDNKRERKDYERGYRDFHVPYTLGNLPAEFARLTAQDDETVDDVADKERRYAALVRGAGYRNARLLADMWCAAFVWNKTYTDLGRQCPTERFFRRVEAGPHSMTPEVRNEVERIREQYQFFHWHLSFPEVFRLPGDGHTPENDETGWNGGFEVVLGNPPWEGLQTDAQEFFALRAPQISSAQNMAQRNRLIAGLEATDADLFRAWHIALRRGEAERHFIRASCRYSSSSYGRLNTYSLFAEMVGTVIARGGRWGMVLPTGIATDAFNQGYFAELVHNRLLVSFFSFENEEFVFPAVHHAFKFALMTVARRAQVGDALFGFFLRQVTDLTDHGRRYALSSSDIQLLNPNTFTCPVFRTSQDALLTTHVYHRFPVILNQRTGDNPWGVQSQLMFMMNTVSEIAVTAEELAARGISVDPSNAWRLPGLLPMYEGKMFHQFDCRFGTYWGQTEAQSRQGKLPEFDLVEHANPSLMPMPRYWLKWEDIARSLGSRAGARWLVAWRDVTSSVVQRTVIFVVLPMAGTNDSAPLAHFPDRTALEVSTFIAALNSFVADFVARQKLGGNHLRLFTFRQLPVPPPWQFSGSPPWAEPGYLQWYACRFLELTYTAWPLDLFGQDCGYDGPPFVWDPQRRFLLRCELDAAFFHVYLGSEQDWEDSASKELLACFPTPRHAVEYIMHTFRIVRERDVAAHGSYRTKRVILEMYDAMAEAIRIGQPYQTRLDPPPGPPADAAGNFIPLSEWDTHDWPPHIHPPRPDRQRLERGRIVLDVLLLLEAWESPVSISALEAALVLMRNGAARKALLSHKLTPGEKAKLSGHPDLIRGLDIVYHGLEANGAIRRVGEHGYELARPELLAEVSQADREKAAEVIRAVSRLSDIRSLPEVVAELIHERYEATV